MKEAEELEVVASTLPPVKYNVTQAALDELKAKYEVVPAEDYNALRKGIAECRDLRVDIEKHRKHLKKDALEYGRMVDSAAKDLTAKIEAIESPMKAAKDVIDAEKARIKAEKEEAERQRVAAINAKISSISNRHLELHNATPDEISNAITEMMGKTISDAEYAEYAGEAQMAVDTAIAKLGDLLAARKAQIAEAARIEAERKALEEQRRIEAEKQAEEAKRLAEERAKLDAERAAEQQKLAAERAELEAARKEVEEAKRAQEEAAAAERRRIELEAVAERRKREQEEAVADAKRRAQAAKPELEKLKEWVTRLRELAAELDAMEINELTDIKAGIQDQLARLINIITPNQINK